MSRRRGRASGRDPVGDRVARSFLAEDLAHAREFLTRDDRLMLAFLFEQPDRDPDRDSRAIRRLTGRIRVDENLCGRLLTYLGDRVPAGMCTWCGRDLPQREPGRPGRPRRYCDANHRQSACRARRWQARRGDA